jgi:hypothetical protein
MSGAVKLGRGKGKAPVLLKPKGRLNIAGLGMRPDDYLYEPAINVWLRARRPEKSLSRILIKRCELCGNWRTLQYCLDCRRS